MKKDNLQRTYEKMIGLSFLAATAAYATGNQMLTTILGSGKLSVAIWPGMALELLNSLAVLLIGVLCYQLLHHYGRLPAWGYVLTRSAEATLLGIGAFSVFYMTPDNTQSLLHFRTVTFSAAMVVLGAYSIYFCYHLLMRKLAPKLLMWLGLVGYSCLLVYALLPLFSVPASMWLFAPGGLFEILFPIYLIIRGFRHPSTAKS